MRLQLAGIAAVTAALLAGLFGTGGPSTALEYIVSALVALGALIFIHELGHFLVAKAVGVGVERFSLGFGPRLWSLRRGETEYCVSAVPLGGYVKMVGEEAHGEELIHPEVDRSEPARPRGDETWKVAPDRTTVAPQGDRPPPSDPAKSFVLKPLWARTLIVLAGPGMNFVLAAVLFSLIFAVLGVPVVPTTVGRVLPDSAAARAGLQPGDGVLAVDGQAIQHWGQLEERVARSDGRPLRLTVARGAERRDVVATPKRVPVRTPFGEPVEVWSLGARPYVPPVVKDVLPGHPATEAGLKPGDRIVALNGQPIHTWDEMAEIISTRPDERIAVSVERGGQRLEIAVTPRAETERDAAGNEIRIGRIGITAPQTHVRSDPITVVTQGIVKTADMTVLTVVMLWKLVTGRISTSNIGGPLQIGVMVGQAAQRGVLDYIFLVAVISVNLAVINLFPVPVLDGGHLLFFGIEAVQGRPLSLRKREIAQQVGLALVLVLMAFVLYNDSRQLGRLLK